MFCRSALLCAALGPPGRASQLRAVCELHQSRSVRLSGVQQRAWRSSAIRRAAASSERSVE
eukprot:15056141-Alexandrium_andersonii.AAC.1